MRPSDEDLGGGDHADAGQWQERGAAGLDELAQVEFELVGLGFEELDSARRGSQSSDRSSMLERVLGAYS